jgi:glycine/D-amino acid oxidase-like deaminating enzyme
MTAPDYETVVIGAGFSGFGTPIKLDKSGMGDYLVIETADGPGGTWHWNTYPGIAVDIPTFSYQFSFEQSSDWTRTYAPGHELKGYAEHCVDKTACGPKSGSTPRCSTRHSTTKPTCGTSRPMPATTSPRAIWSTPAAY